MFSSFICDFILQHFVCSFGSISTDVSKTTHSALYKKIINKIFQNNWEMVYDIENISFRVASLKAGVIIPMETLNADFGAVMHEITENNLLI